MRGAVTICAALALALPARAGVALVQHAAFNQTTKQPSVSLTLPNPTDAGDLLLVVGGFSNSPTQQTFSVTPTDDEGNTYTLIDTAGDAGGQLCAMYFAFLGDAGAGHTVTWGVTPLVEPLAIAVAEFSGVSAYSGVSSAAEVPPARGTASPDSGFVVPLAPGSLVFGAMSHDARFITDAGGGFTLLDVVADDASVYNPAADEYQVQGAPVPVAATFTLTGATDWGAIVAVFDAKTSPPDAGPGDAGPDDAGVKDAGTASDAGTTPTDAGLDGGASFDAGSIDAGNVSPDAGPRPDASTPEGADAGAPPPGQEQPEFGWSCGCQSMDGAAFAALGWILLLAARRRSSLE